MDVSLDTHTVQNILRSKKKDGFSKTMDISLSQIVRCSSDALLAWLAESVSCPLKLFQSPNNAFVEQ